jgi:hypothetical protein
MATAEKIGSEHKARERRFLGLKSRIVGPPREGNVSRMLRGSAR